MSLTDSTEAIQSVFQGFECSINDADLNAFRSIELEEVYKAIHIIEQDQEQCRRMYNLRRIEPVLENLGKLGDIVSALYPNTVNVRYLWAPVKLLLQIADERDQSLKQLLSAYSAIGGRLSLIEGLSYLVKIHPDSSQTLIDLCNDILGFHAQTYELFRRGGWKTLFDAAWKSSSARLDATLHRIDLIRTLVDQQIARISDAPATGNVYTSTEVSGNARVHQGNVYHTTFTNPVSSELSDLLQHSVAETTSLRNKLLEDLDKREKEQRDWRVRECIAWLELDGFDQEQESQYSKRADLRENNTCEWILDHPLLQKWLDHDDRHKYLWLKGKPGSGKTTLATYILEKAPFPPGSFTLFCLCSQSFGSSKSDSCSLLFRSLVAQILRKHPSGAAFVYEEYVKVAELPSLRNLVPLLRTLLNCVPSAYVVIDGLDECDQDVQQMIVKKLDVILSAQGDDDLTAASCVKVLLSSRDSKTIPSRLRKEPTVFLTDESIHVSKDIKLYTLRNIAELRDRFSEAQIDEIASEIVAKANGMFLWVRLVIGSLLGQDSLDDLQNAVRLLPKGLKALYQAIIHQIELRADDRQQLYVRRIFTWMALSRRPLKTWELCDAVVLCDPHQKLTERTKLGKGILDHCKPLLEENNDETVSFIHLSVKEFLLTKPSGPYIQPHEGVKQVAATCMRYLLGCEDFFLAERSPASYRNIVVGFHDLFSYIHEYWDQHLLDLEAYKDSLASASPPSNLLTVSWNVVANQVNDPRSNVARKASQLLLEVEFGLGSAQPTGRDTSGRTSTRCVGISIDMVLNKLETSDQDTLTAESNLTPIDLAYSCFREQFEQLLQNHTFFTTRENGITSAEMSTFRARHASEAFLCPWKGCPRSIKGFDNMESRDKHVDKHLNQFRCPESGCEFSNSSLASRAALKRHILKYHTASTEVKLPQFPRIRRQNFPSSDTIPSRSQQQSPQQFTPTIHVPPVTSQFPASPASAVAMANDYHPGMQRANQHQQGQGLQMSQQTQKMGLGNFGFDDSSGPESNQGFGLGYSALDNAEILENFDFDSFLNTIPDDGFDFHVEDVNLVANPSSSHPKASLTPAVDASIVDETVSNNSAAKSISLNKPFEPPELTKEDEQWINSRAAEMAKQTPLEDMRKIVESIDPRIRQVLQEKKIDPIIYYFRMKATKEFRTIQVLQQQQQSQQQRLAQTQHAQRLAQMAAQQRQMQQNQQSAQLTPQQKQFVEAQMQARREAQQRQMYQAQKAQMEAQQRQIQQNQQPAQMGAQLTQMLAQKGGSISANTQAHQGGTNPADNTFYHGQTAPNFADPWAHQTSKYKKAQSGSSRSPRPGTNVSHQSADDIRPKTVYEYKGPTSPATSTMSYPYYAPNNSNRETLMPNKDSSSVMGRGQQDQDDTEIQSQKQVTTETHLAPKPYAQQLQFLEQQHLRRQQLAQQLHTQQQQQQQQQHTRSPPQIQKVQEFGQPSYPKPEHSRQDHTSSSSAHEFASIGTETYAGESKTPSRPTTGLPAVTSPQPFFQLPAALLAQYPQLANLDWNAISQNTDQAEIRLGDDGDDKDLFRGYGDLPPSSPPLHSPYIVPNSAVDASGPPKSFAQPPPFQPNVNANPESSSNGNTSGASTSTMSQMGHAPKISQPQSRVQGLPDTYGFLTPEQQWHIHHKMIEQQQTQQPSTSAYESTAPSGIYPGVDATPGDKTPTHSTSNQYALTASDSSKAGEDISGTTYYTAEGSATGQIYSMPPADNGKTQGDLTSIDQILEQMQATIYENDTRLAQPGPVQIPDHSFGKCVGCNGTGIRTSLRTNGTMIQRFQTECPDCRGTGKTIVWADPANSPGQFPPSNPTPWAPAAANQPTTEPLSYIEFWKQRQTPPLPRYAPTIQHPSLPTLSTSAQQIPPYVSVGNLLTPPLPNSQLDSGTKSVDISYHDMPYGPVF